MKKHNDQKHVDNKESTRENGDCKNKSVIRPNYKTYSNSDALQIRSDAPQNRSNAPQIEINEIILVDELELSQVQQL